MAGQGFSYSSKERRFRRECPPFRQAVYIKFRRASRQDYCEFDPHFEIRSEDYERWYRRVWGEDPPDHRADLLFSQPAYFNDDWPKRGNFLTRHLPWKIRPGRRTKFFHLTNASRDRREMKEVAEAMLGPLMDGFDRLSSWEALAEANKGFYARPEVLIGPPAKSKQWWQFWN